MARFSLLALAFTSGVLSQYTDPHTGISFAGPVQADLTFGVALPETAGSDFIGQIIAPKGGYAAVSLGGTMVSSLLIIAWPNGDSAVGSIRTTSGYVAPIAYQNAAVSLSPIANGTYTNSTHLSYTFLCTGCLGASVEAAHFGASDPMAMIGWATSNTPVTIPSSAAGAVLSFHDSGFGLFGFNPMAGRSPQYAMWAGWAKGGSTGGGNPATSSVKPTSSVPLPTTPVKVSTTPVKVSTTSVIVPTTPVVTSSRSTMALSSPAAVTSTGVATSSTAVATSSRSTMIPSTLVTVTTTKVGPSSAPVTTVKTKTTKASTTTKTKTTKASTTAKTTKTTKSTTAKATSTKSSTPKSAQVGTSTAVAPISTGAATSVVVPTYVATDAPVSSRTASSVAIPTVTATDVPGPTESEVMDCGAEFPQ